MLKHFTLTNFPLESGQVVPELTLSYSSFGRLNHTADNVVLYPTYYTGTHEDNARVIASGRALDPQKYFIIVPNMFGNGISSSPSSTSPPFNGSRFPATTIYDNVIAQQALLEHLGVNKVRLVLGWSMGGLQAYHWCVHAPTTVENALIICATAKTSTHNNVFLEGVKAALTADQNYNAGNYRSAPNKGLMAFARVYAGWAYSQDFFRHRHYLALGFDNAEQLLASWEQDHLSYDANNLLSMLNTWQTADIGSHSNFNGDTQAALNSIKAQVWLMPCEQDLYFRHEDNREELKHLQHAQYCGYQSDFGHCSAGPDRFSEETALIERTIKNILQD